MTQILNGGTEPDEQDVPVRITLPAEFAGAAMAEVNTRRGRVLGMKMQQDEAVIRVSLPASECEALTETLAAATLRHGRVDRDPQEG